MHVHGHLGNYIDNEGQIDFGRQITKERYLTARSGIQIVHENNGDTSEFKTAQKLLHEAKKVLFIGFGFHPQNMTKLGFRMVKEINALVLTKE